MKYKITFSASQKEPRKSKTYYQGFETVAVDTLENLGKYMLTHALCPQLFGEENTPTQKGYMVPWRKAEDNVTGHGNIIFIDIDNEYKDENKKKHVLHPDEQTTFEDVETVMKKHNMAGVITPSKSSKEGHIKIHATIVTKDPVPDHAEYQKCYMGLVELFEKEGVDIDPAMKSSIQNLTPAKGREIVSIVEGSPFDFDAIAITQSVSLSTTHNGQKTFDPDAEYVEIQPDQKIYHHGEEIGTFGELSANAVFSGQIRCDCPFDSNEHSDHKGDDYAFINAEGIAICSSSTTHEKLRGVLEVFGNEKVDEVVKTLDELIETVEIGDTTTVKKIMGFISKLKDPIDQDMYRELLAVKKILSKSAFDKSLRKLTKTITKPSSSLVGWDGQKGAFCEIVNNITRFYKKADYVTTLASRHTVPEDAIKEGLIHVPEVEVIYRPGGVEKGIEMNTWNGVDYEPNGKGHKLIDKVLDNLFHNQPEDKEFFIKWMAYIVQEHVKTGIAWGFFGDQGTGKGLIVSVMQKLLGHKNCALNISDDDLQGTFNGHIVWEKEFIHLNEIASDYHGRHGVSGKLKAFITDPVVQVRIKKIPEFSAPNYVNVILHSNKSNPIELEEGDRRWNIVECNTKLDSFDWWESDSHLKILTQAHDFGEYLMNLDVTQKDACTLRPMSDAKRKVMEQTIPHHVQLGNFINKKDHKGLIKYLLIDDDVKPYEVSKKDIKKACEEGWWENDLLVSLYEMTTEERDVTPKRMTQRLKTVLRDGEHTRKRVNGVRKRGWEQK